ncbi:MAG: acetate kinase [Abditibacteriota bacterium]|nr:acetate kinase [Abditibacteriota bacterium]
MLRRTILTVNTGSSSVRLSAFEVGQSDLRLMATERLEAETGEPEELLRAFLNAHDLKTFTVVAHRIVHGGAQFTTTTHLTADTESAIADLSPLAPLHNPRALRWSTACRAVLGDKVLQVGVFDTAFTAHLPAVAATYALPGEICRKHGIRRFGFHGLAHSAMNRRWRQLRPDIENGGRVISLQLGSGCSITAVACGVPQDTSMGFSTLEGLVMATRSGDVDAGVLAFLQRTENLSPNEIESLLNTKSGLLGVSGISGDMRVLLESDDPRAALAVELFCYRARKYLGAYLAVLGGADAVLFGGGVGENAAPIRERILSGLEWCGLIFDGAANAAATGCEARISSSDSRIEVWVVPVDEATTLAQEAVALLRHAEKL